MLYLDNLFHQGKALGDYLVVGVHSDGEYFTNLIFSSWLLQRILQRTKDHRFILNKKGTTSFVCDN